MGHTCHCWWGEGELWLSTAQATHTTPGPQCDLQGLWRNELGSSMTILNTAGTFSGSTHTAGAATNKPILVSPLHPTFGFTVQWQLSATAVTLILCSCWEPVGRGPVTQGHLESHKVSSVPAISPHSPPSTLLAHFPCRVDSSIFTHIK
uniref:AVID protein n=1 Tax=Serinus canaria TaxID=9135 RepID=A0A8C9MGK4_SERCA